MLKELEGDAKPMWGREEKRKKWTKHWQCDSEVQGVEDKPWKKEEFRSMEEGLLAQAEGRELRKSSEELQGYYGAGCDGFHLEVLPDLSKETKEIMWCSVGDGLNELARRCVS